ncbi:MAG: EAL domain-containing protein [Thermoanaerobaculia bacterium]
MVARWGSPRSQCPVHKLKIAMEFVQGATEDPDDASIVDAVISLGHKLGLKVIDEGVETEEQVEFLRAHGCDEAQGFSFSRPVAPDAFAEQLLRNGARAGSPGPRGAF